MSRIRTRRIRDGIWKTASGVTSVDPDELKRMVREGLTSMTLEEREAFIVSLQSDLQSANLSMRAYLFPIGISAQTLQELTPGEVGHLIRYLKINVPSAKPVVDHLMESLGVLAEKIVTPSERLAA